MDTSKKSRPLTPPTPQEIRSARHSVGMTQEAASALLERGDRWWRALENGSRKISPIEWQVWRIRAGIDPPESITSAMPPSFF